MGCKRWQRAVALLVEGDLPAGRAASVSAHLERCSTCRQFAEELRETQAALHALTREPIPDALCAEVRERVFAATVLAGQAVVRHSDWKEPARRLALYATACITVTIVLGSALYLASVTALPTDAPMQAPAPHVSALAPEPPEVPLERTLVAGNGTVSSRAHESPGAARQPLVVKLYTDNPNLTIIWLADLEGD